jgi:hypothetical protein
MQLCAALDGVAKVPEGLGEVAGHAAMRWRVRSSGRHHASHAV